MTVYLLGAGPGYADLLTVRAVEVLARAEVVVVDRLVGDEVLALIPPGAKVIDVGKRPVTKGHGGDPSTLQETINEVLVAEGTAGRRVVRLKGGDPFLFGRGGEEAEALAAAGVDYEIIPGVSSAFALPALAGVPVTHRGVARAVVVVSGHEPVETSSVEWSQLARSGATLIVLMGVARRGAIADALIAAGLSEETAVAAIERGATPRERVLRTTLGTLADLELDAPAVMVIGDVAGFDFRDRAHRPLEGVRITLTRPRARSGELLRSLRAAGALVASTPLIETRAASDGGASLARALEDPAGLSWIVVTSATAVAPLVAAAGDLRSLHGVKVAAVGETTATRLVAAGLPPELVGDGRGARSLADAFPDPGPEDGSILMAVAEEGRDELRLALGERGWDVVRAAAYETAPVEQSAAALDALRRSEIIVFASPSAVHAYRTALGDAVAPMPQAVAIGSTTLDALHAAGFADPVVATTPSDEGLLHACIVASQRLERGA